MAGVGRISVLVSRELQVLLTAVRGLDREVRAQIRKQTKPVVLPVWQEAVRGRVTTRLETRALSDTARVAVSDSNVTLRSGGVGKLSSGLPISEIAHAVENGADPNKPIAQRSRSGSSYTRRRGATFRPPRRAGYVVYPAAREVIPRIASLWIQTAVRTIHEIFEKGGAR